jgi:hypothetical protein
MMSPQTKTERALSRPDAAALIGFMVSGAVIAVWVVVNAVRRVLEVIPNRDVPVTAVFDGTPAQAPLGPDGAAVTVELATARLIAPELPVASVIALVIEQIALVATVLVVVGALLWLTKNIVRGTIFSRTNTALVSTAGIVGLLGFCAVPFFANMGANGAFAWISDRTFDNAVMSVDLFPLLLLAFIAALASTVFTVGDRLQRETAGLV